MVHALFTVQYNTTFIKLHCIIANIQGRRQRFSRGGGAGYGPCVWNNSVCKAHHLEGYLKGLLWCNFTCIVISTVNYITDSIVVQEIWHNVLIPIWCFVSWVRKLEKVIRSGKLYQHLSAALLVLLAIVGQPSFITDHSRPAVIISQLIALGLARYTNKILFIAHVVVSKPQWLDFIL